jgi:NhaP-type Na+/H+ or K+/H+ antiporter
MKNTILISISSIPIIGVLSQWIAWMLRIPAIVLFLICGFMMGPILGIINPDELFGDVLYPFVSVSVAIILFEGGLSLKFSDLKRTGSIIGNLVTIGALLTWILSGIAAYLLFGFELAESFLMGAILVVTGPTVIIPLLKQIKIKRSVTSILRWEGIVIDPIGAALSVLMFDIVIAQSTTSALNVAATVIISTVLLGVILGGIGAGLLILVIKYHWVPGFLQEGFTLIVVLSTYVISNIIQPESGLLVVTIMGIIMANQRIIIIRHIITFKEQLVTLLLSSLFIVLAATTKTDQLLSVLSWPLILFLCALIFIIRPLMVFVSTYGSTLTLKDKLFMSFMAPRGIVAAAVASLFALELQQAGIAIGDELLSIVFIVIIVTVVVYGLMGRPMALLLDMKPSRQGVIIIGAHDWAIDIAKALITVGIPVTTVDTNRGNVISARSEGLNAIHANVLSNRILEEVETGNVDTLLALTGSDELNLLATLEYVDHFGESKVYRLCSTETLREFSIAHSGRQLFARRVTHTYLSIKKTTGYHVKVFSISDEYPYSKFLFEYKKAIPLFVVDPKKGLTVISVESPIVVAPNQYLIAMV